MLDIFGMSISVSLLLFGVFGYFFRKDMDELERR